MKLSYGIKWALVVLVTITTTCTSKILAQQFIHPGINQSAQDLALMKKMVIEGRQPYKDAFERLKAGMDTVLAPKAHAHVLRGPYGKPNIGGDDLSKSANIAYNYSLIWYVSNDQRYADKAIALLNDWSAVLHDFDYNDAKLLAAWTGHLLCNAAEILRYNNAGWQQKDIDGFTNMLMAVYYPLMRYYYPQANGNWDGAIIHSIIAIAIFTNNREMYNNAIDHYKHAPVNGSLFKYVYPNGQCQETPRDQGHVQLGLGEFAGAAQVAYTQGVDLFSIAGNRLALGYEYTAQFLLGEKPFCYCVISERAKNLRDDYEYIYRHYLALGIALPYTKRAADSVRSKASRSVLTAVRAQSGKIILEPVVPKASSIGYIAGAGLSTTVTIPENSAMVSPGQSIQQALDATAGTGKWVIVKAGLHTLPATLKIPAGITLVGEGAGSILFLDPASANRDAMVNAGNDLHDVTIRDLVIEGSNKTDPGTDPNTNRSYRGGYNRGGIVFRSSKNGEMQRISFINLTIRNCTYNGIFMSGGGNITISNCDLNENGSSVVPGPKLQHNLLLTHCSGVKISGSRLDTSPFGSGISLGHCTNVSVENCEIARNAYYGLLMAACKNILVKGNLIEANDRSGLMMEFLFLGNENITISNNLIHFNNGYAVESYATLNSQVRNNTCTDNGKNVQQEKISTEKIIIMD